MSTATEQRIESLTEILNDDAARHKPGCISGSILGQDETTGQIIVIPCCCKSWTCPACANRLRNLWANRAVKGQPERFLTMTVDPKLHPDPHEARVAIQKAWTSFVAHWRKGRKAKGDKHAIPEHELEYISVWERHKSGFPHMHALVRGEYIPQAYLRSWFITAGVGEIVHIKAVDDVRAAVCELLKYVSKAADDVTGYFQGFRLINASQNYVPAALKPPTPENTPGFSWTACITDAATVVATMIRDLGYELHPDSLPGRIQLIPFKQDWDLLDLKYQVNALSHLAR